MRLAIVALLPLVGCAAGLTGPRLNVQPATAEQVASCRYVDDIVGTSGWYGMFATKGIENARQDVFERASAAGATHVVWQAPTVVYGSSTTTAKAYRCPS